MIAINLFDFRVLKFKPIPRFQHDTQDFIPSGSAEEASAGIQRFVFTPTGTREGREALNFKY